MGQIQLEFPAMDIGDAPTEQDLAECVRLAELAYGRMYDSRHPKDDRDDALYLLEKAMRIARALNLKEKEAELAARSAHIEQVFNAQFRYL